jgi:hypothetical protein
LMADAAETPQRRSAGGAPAATANTAGASPREQIYVLIRHEKAPPRTWPNVDGADTIIDPQWRHPSQSWGRDQRAAADRRPSPWES